MNDNNLTKIVNFQNNVGSSSLGWKLIRWYGVYPYFRMAAMCSGVGYPMFLSHPYCGYSSAIFLMYSSRHVLASTDAAAMDANVASPFTTGR